MTSQMVVRLIRNFAVLGLMVAYLAAFAPVALADGYTTCAAWCQAHAGNYVAPCVDACGFMSGEQADGITWQQARTDCLSYCSGTYPTGSLSWNSCRTGCGAYPQY